MKRTPTQPQDKYVLRLPDGMRDRLKAEAEMSGRSMNAEIVHRLKETLEADDISRDKPKGDRATTVNLPFLLRSRIYAAAEDNERTLGSEILYTLEREYPDLAPINDIIDSLNRALDRARSRRSKRDLYELEMAISDIDAFYRHELVNEEIKPSGDDIEIHPLKIGGD